MLKYAKVIIWICSALPFWFSFLIYKMSQAEIIYNRLCYASIVFLILAAVWLGCWDEYFKAKAKQ